MNVATPIPASVARVADRAAKRVGYRWVGICQICPWSVIRQTDTSEWIHRDSGASECETTR